jgi:isocitrate lyase
MQCKSTLFSKDSPYFCTSFIFSRYLCVAFSSCHSPGERTVEGFYRIKGGIDSAIARGLAYAPYADLVWFETSEPSLEEATKFAKALHEKYPGKLLAYNCSPSFNWKKKLDDATIAKFQQTLGELGYKFQVGWLWS